MTDTNQASELHELCKKVYELTKWEQRANISELYEYWDDYDELCVISVEDTDDELTPAYNSDYLLEKLPAHFYGGTIAMTAETDEGPTRYSFFYEDNYETAKVVHCKNVRLQGWDDTPLKALLKLTIALSEAGELNDQSS